VITVSFLFYFGHCIVCLFFILSWPLYLSFLFYFVHSIVCLFLFYFGHCTVCFILFWPLYCLFFFILFWPLYWINIMMGHNSCTLNTTLVFHEINMSSIIPYDVKRQLLTLYTLILRIQRRNR
jgi:hypothetical protein